jgi:hypothetical protein
MKKIGFLVLAVVLAIGALGIGYASWTDTIYIDGTVGTGSVCVEWNQTGDWDSSCPVDDNYYVGPGNGDVNLDVAAITGDTEEGWPNDCPYYYWYKTDKNVACMDVVRNADKDLLTVTLYNAYPLYYADLEIHARNCGSVPVKLQSFDIVDENFTVANYPWDPEGSPCEDETWNNGQIYVELSGVNEGIQLETGDEDVYSLIIIVQQSAEMNRGSGGTDPYQFTIELDWIQWDHY